MDTGPPLREQAATWSLASNKQLLNTLQDMQQKVTEKAKETNDKFECVMSDVSKAGVSLDNVNNRFALLSNNQFTEARVYDDDTDIAAVDTTKDETIPAIKPVKKSDLVLRKAMEILQKFHEEIVIFFDDSECSSDDEYKRRTFLRLKNMYADRPLPHIIGSNNWKKKWHAGLIAEDSDDEGSDQNKDQEEYSDTDEEIQTNRQTLVPDKKDVISAIVESSLIEEVKIKPADVEQPEQVIAAETNVKSQSDFAAELAHRLTQGQPTKTIEENDEPVVISKNNDANVKHIFTDKIEQHKIVSGVVFADEPPPLPQSDDDDIFADMHMSNSSFKTDNNKQIEELFSDDNDIFDDMPHLNVSVDICSRKGYPGSAIRKRYRIQSSSSDDDTMDAYKCALKSDEDNKNQENNSNENKNVKTEEPNKKFTLSDDIFDDFDEEIFANVFFPKPSLKQTNVTKLFDDDVEDRLFADIDIQPDNVTSESFKKGSEDVLEQDDKLKSNTEVTGNIDETTGNRDETAGNREEPAGNIEETASNREETSGNIEETAGNSEEAVNTDGNQRRRYVLPPDDIDLVGYESEEDNWPTDSRLPPNSRYIINNRFLNNEKILSAARKPNNRQSIRKAIFDEIMPICETLDKIIINVENKTNAINERRRNEARLAEANINVSSTNDVDNIDASQINNATNVDFTTTHSMAENYNRAESDAKNSKESDTFLDPSVDEVKLLKTQTEIPISNEMKSEGSPMEHNIAANTETKIINNLKETRIGSSADDFNSAFKDQPPTLNIKENKKSSNINALFGDDSDDESLFFKKNNSIVENSPVTGFTQDEPPIRSVNNAQNTPDINKNNDGKITEEVPAGSENATPKQGLDDNTVLGTDDEIQRVDITDGVSKLDGDKKVIGKIKSNVNINVNTLLPGASPTKTKNAQYSAIPKSISNLESYVQEKDNCLNNTLIKSSSFEDDPDSPVLCNKKSKERAKIQVKRRPSSRKARIDALNKSSTIHLDKQQDNIDGQTEQKCSDTTSIVTVTNKLTEEPSNVLDNIQANKNENTLSGFDDMFKPGQKPDTNVTKAPKVLNLTNVLDDSDDDIFTTFAVKDDDNIKSDVGTTKTEVKSENPFSDDSGDEMIFKTSHNTLTRIVKPKNNDNYKCVESSNVTGTTSDDQKRGAIPKTKIVRTTMFDDDDSDSPDLYVELSKDKPKQPAKKRTTSRKSRKDTCRNSDKYLMDKTHAGVLLKTSGKRYTAGNDNNEDKSVNTAISHNQYKKYDLKLGAENNMFKTIAKPQKSKTDSVPKEFDPLEQLNKKNDPEGSDEDIFATFSKKPDETKTMKRSEGPINIKKKPEIRQPVSDDSEDELIFKTSHNTLTRIVKPKKDITNKPTEPPKVAKQEISMFDSSGDEELFDTKQSGDIFAKNKDKTALNKAIRNNTLFGDDSTEELFGGPSKPQVLESLPPKTDEKVMSATSEVFDDPLTAFQNEEEQFF